MPDLASENSLNCFQNLTSTEQNQPGLFQASSSFQSLALLPLGHHIRERQTTFCGHLQGFPATERKLHSPHFTLPTRFLSSPSLSPTLNKTVPGLDTQGHFDEKSRAKSKSTPALFPKLLQRKKAQLASQLWFPASMPSPLPVESFALPLCHSWVFVFLLKLRFRLLEGRTLTSFSHRSHNYCCSLRGRRKVNCWTWITSGRHSSHPQGSKGLVPWRKKCQPSEFNRIRCLKELFVSKLLCRSKDSGPQSRPCSLQLHLYAS